VIVYKNPQRQWLAAAEQELAQKLQERAIIDNRIAKLQTVIESLSAALQDSEQTINMSIPQLCLHVLSLSGAFQSPPQIRDGLAQLGIHINAPNPLGVIHTTLGRLVSSGYAQPKPTPVGGSTQYRITTSGRAALQGW
jgi:hypothetical protein